MKNIYLIFILFLGFSAYSQAENDNWYFGDKAAVNFSGTPVALTNSAMNAPEACGSVSDSQGNLIFYTDGKTIWNREHNIMTNGAGLTGTLNSAQVLVIGDLVNKDIYYVFTTANSYNNQSYTAYSVVDMSLGGIGVNGQPLGGVVNTLKNIPVLDNNNNLITTDGITAVPYANGTDFWILIPTHQDLMAYLFDGSGFSTTPIVSSLSVSATNKSFSVKASPKLSYTIGFDYYVAVSVGHNLQPDQNNLYAFDNNLGLLLNNVGVISFANAQQKRQELEFSQDGKIVYLGGNSSSNNYGIYNCDLTVPGVIQLLFSNSGASLGQMQLHTNGTIYFTIAGAGSLGQISNPNLYNGNSISVPGIFLNGKVSAKGLPQLLPRHPGYINNIILALPENNNNYTYYANNTITMQSNYSITNKTIVMKAGDNILFMPDTEIGLGSNYTAVIEACPVSKPSQRYWMPPAERQTYTVGRENNLVVLKNDVKVYPNPTNSPFVIDITGSEIQKWELFDLSGKLVLQGKEPVGSVNGLAKATYVLKVSLKNKEVETHKLIVK